MNKHFKLPILIKILLITAYLLPVSAIPSWYEQKLEGWYYFEDKTTSQEKSLSPEEAEECVSMQSRKLKQLLSLALVSPTPSNVENYIREQRQLIQQSNMFAEAWGKVLLSHPDLSEFLTNPTSSFGILAKRANDLKLREELLNRLSKSYFLLFFFKGSDPLAQKAAEAALAFAETNNWKYKAVSLDGIGLPQLDEFETDKGISEHFAVSSSPSFFIVNPVDNQAYPVGAGLIAVSEIEANIETQIGKDNE